MPKEKTIRQTSFLFFLLAISLHQSAVTLLGNVSFADFILIFLLFNLLFNRKFQISGRHIVILMLLVVYTLFVSVFVTSSRFNINVSGSGLVAEIIKLIALFFFFFIGVIIVKEKQFNFFVKVYSYSAFVMAILGIIFSSADLPIINMIFFKYGDRFNGFMNDPNYFAILQISALPFFFKNTHIKKTIAWTATISIIFSVILSGSKTGILSLLIYLIIHYLEKKVFIQQTLTLEDSLFSTIKVGFLFIGVLTLFTHFTAIIEQLNIIFPVTLRITTLFTDFESSVSAGGSDRAVAWSTGLAIIKESPFFGIGVGNYVELAHNLLGVDIIAHNSYIQLAVEWGIPLTILFFSGVFLQIIIVTIRYLSNLELSIQKDILVIFLLGSMGISLNNGRLFWLVLGAFFYTLSLKKNIKM